MDLLFFRIESKPEYGYKNKNVEAEAHSKPVPVKGIDTLFYHHTLNSVLGISNKQQVAIAWVYSDSSSKRVYASQTPFESFKFNSISVRNLKSCLLSLDIQFP